MATGRLRVLYNGAEMIRQATTLPQGKFRIWLRAVRPFAFTASVVPVLVGAALAAARGGARWELLPLVLGGVVLLNAGTNLVSEVRDFHRGLDTPDSLGSRNVLVEGLLEPKQVFRAGLGAFAAGSAAGLLLARLCGPAVLWLGLAGLLGGFFYTGRPIAYKYVALGNPLVFVLMGPLIVVGSHLVLAGEMTAESIYVSLPVGCLVAAILSANNLRDIEHDKRAGARTLATVLGHTGAKLEYCLLLCGAYAAVAVMAAAGAISPWALLVLLSVPPAARNVISAARSARDRPEQIAHLDVQTAKLHLLFGVLLIVGLLAGALT